MHRYTAYGLNVASELLLPELSEAQADCRPQVVVRCGRIDGSALRVDNATLLWAKPADACLRYDGTGTFRILAGRQILIDAFDGADARAVRLLLLGPVLAVLLHQRGMLVLHASAIALPSGVAAFIADKGEGKSTFAAALHARGHPLVADDLVAVQLDHPQLALVSAGFPQLKLAPEVLKQLGQEPESLPRLHPDFEKRACRVDGVAHGPLLPLARIYLLEDAEAEAIEHLPPQQRFVELVRHSYLAALLQPTGESGVHFRQVVELASRVPVMRLRRRRDLALLGHVAALVEADARTTP